jgi:hypothetical protein
MYTTTFHLPHSSNGTVLRDMDDELTRSRSWKNSEYVCAFSDDERHLGHIFRTEHWNAYDATRLNEASGGFKYLGSFVDLATAMLAVERSVEQKRELRTMHAGAGMAWANI